MNTTKRIEWIGAKLLSATLMLFALWHMAIVVLDRHKIHPFTKIGWEREQLYISLLFFACGYILTNTSRRETNSDKALLPILFSVANISTLCMLIFLRYFWLSSAILAFISLIYLAALLNSFSEINKFVYSLAFSACLIIFALFLIFVGTSYFGVGN